VRRWPKPLVREGIQAIVFTTINAEPTLWDVILPEAALRLPVGLVEIDRLLDDPRFFEPFSRSSVPDMAGRRSRWRPICG
jgi:hypothetical protein